MGQQPEIVLYQRPIEAFAAVGLMGPGKPIEHKHSLAPARIPLHPLRTGRAFLESWRLRELPVQGMWHRPHYDSYAPPLFVINRPLIHSSAGIVAVGDQAIAETLSHTEPAKHGFRNLMRAIAIPRRTPRRLPGTYISLLAGGEGNYYHSVLLGLARLASVPENYQAAAAGLLVPEGAANQREVLALMDLMPSLSIVEVGHDETLHVDTLILPLSICGDTIYHPCVLDFYRGISTNVSPPRTRMPTHIYLDRRETRLRPLVNENAIVTELMRLGIEPVRPESMSVADQVRLFRGAELIVAPHGAALTNLGFCRPGTQVVELLMDAYTNWCFRHLAALAGLNYDCVLGRARSAWGELVPSFHATPWEISTTHVAAAVAQYTQPTRTLAAAAA
jgi:capsular polysaccharide biosynthesis protein